MGLKRKDTGSQRNTNNCSWYLCYICLSLEIALEMQTRFKLKMKKKAASLMRLVIGGSACPWEGAWMGPVEGVIDWGSCENGKKAGSREPRCAWKLVTGVSPGMNKIQVNIRSKTGISRK